MFSRRITKTGSKLKDLGHVFHPMDLNLHTYITHDWKTAISGQVTKSAFLSVTGQNQERFMKRGRQNERIE